MKALSFAYVFAAVLALSIGGLVHGEEGKVTGTDVKKQAEETLDAARKYAVQQRDEYQRKMEQELKELGEKIATLKDRAQNATGESLRAIQEKMGVLRERQAAAEKRLGELRSSTYQAWSEMKDGVEKAVAELKKAYEGAASLFK